MNVTEQRLETGNAALQEQLDAAKQKIAELEGQLVDVKAEAAACLQFLDTELGWECFRLEYKLGSSHAVSQSEQNAEKLRAYLAEKGHALKFRADKEAAERKLAKAREALEKIQRWKGEFPATGKVYEDGTPISYGVCYGSNGERDFMRSVAQEALAQVEQPQIQANDGVSLIATERRRQVSAEGWTKEHDDWHTRGEIADAAECYAAYASDQVKPNVNPYGRVPRTWPWDRKWWKPSNDPIRNLVKAGALIAAEIDRLLRMGGAQIEQPNQKTPDVLDSEWGGDNEQPHALSELYKDPQFLKEYREGLTEERARLGIEQPQRSPIPPVHPMAGIAAIDRKAQAKLPGEDSDGEPCQCSACVALRARAEVERTP